MANLRVAVGVLGALLGLPDPSSPGRAAPTVMPARVPANLDLAAALASTHGRSCPNSSEAAATTLGSRPKYQSREDWADGNGCRAGRPFVLVAVAGLARGAPTRATADLLDQFVAALTAANDWLHADSPPERGAVAAVYEQTCVVLQDLFGPMSLRLAAMDSLVGLRDPEPRDVELLKQRLGDERHHIYLFDRVDGPGWFRALRDDRLLLPSADGPWSAAPYVARLAETHPDDVRAWLAGLPADLNAKQVGDLVGRISAANACRRSF